jgi:type I restriction enzyme S subunit
MKSGETITSFYISSNGSYPCYGGNGLRGYTARFTHEGSFCLIGRQGALCGNVFEVNGRFFASEHAVVVTANPEIFIPWLTYVLRDMNLNQYSESSAQPGLSVAKLALLPIACPPLAEQKAIAAALSDVDALLSSLDALIAKKRDMKKAAMQELLTGKTRLPGFGADKDYVQTEVGLIPEDWETKSLGEILVIGHGRDYKELPHGDVPVYGTGGYITSVSSYLHDGETVCIGRKGTIDKPMYFKGKIWTVDTLFFTHSFVGCVPKFLFYVFCTINWRGYNEATGVPSLTAKVIESIQIQFPSREEQQAIADVLSDMDAELEALEARYAKVRDMKTGMMQELLTGKTRLIPAGE